MREDNHLIDMDNVREIALKHRPKLILAGGSAYPREIDFAAFRRIADEVGPRLMVDMAHVAGLIAGGVYPSPVPHAHVVTSTTHKTLRGLRGGLILTNDPGLAKKINSAVFLGVQGGPLMHVIAAKAVAFGEALDPSFKTYALQTLANARAMATVLSEGGLSIVSGGTDSYLALVDLRPLGLTGKAAEAALESFLSIRSSRPLHRECRRRFGPQPGGADSFGSAPAVRGLSNLFRSSFIEDGRLVK